MNRRIQRNVSGDTDDSDNESSDVESSIANMQPVSDNESLIKVTKKEFSIDHVKRILRKVTALHPAGRR